MNANLFHNLLTYSPGHPRQASSFGRDPERGGTWCGFRPKPALIKRIMLKPGEVHTMASLEGQGVITRMMMTTLLPFNAHALKGLVLRFYWDGEEHPSVECPFGDFFGAPFGGPAQYAAEVMSITSRAFNCLWPMPYKDGARLEIRNESERTVEPFFYNITYIESEDEPPSGLRFHASWHRENPTRPEAAYTILEAEGKGHYVGCHLNAQNLEWWLRPPLKDIPFPYGFGLGMMEGWESITIDGEEEPSLVGTGTEDFFNGAWYYSVDGLFAAPFHGCLVRDYLRSRIAVYRLDVNAPMPFARSIRVHLDHGFRNQVKGDYSSTAYWYQEEPHRPYAPLPEVSARQPAPALANVAQVALLLGPPLLAGAALLWRLSKRLGPDEKGG